MVSTAPRGSAHAPATTPARGRAIDAGRRFGSGVVVGTLVESASPARSTRSSSQPARPGARRRRSTTPSAQPDLRDPRIDDIHESPTGKMGRVPESLHAGRSSYSPPCEGGVGGVRSSAMAHARPRRPPSIPPSQGGTEERNRPGTPPENELTPISDLMIRCPSARAPESSPAGLAPDLGGLAPALLGLGGWPSRRLRAGCWGRDGTPGSASRPPATAFAPPVPSSGRSWSRRSARGRRRPGTSRSRAEPRSIRSASTAGGGSGSSRVVVLRVISPLAWRIASSRPLRI